MISAYGQHGVLQRWGRCCDEHLGVDAVIQNAVQVLHHDPERFPHHDDSLLREEVAPRAGAALKKLSEGLCCQGGDLVASGWDSQPGEAGGFEHGHGVVLEQREEE